MPEPSAASGAPEPTRDERLAALASTAALLDVARRQVEAARRSVVPSSPRCVLDRPGNFDYQRALNAAATALDNAEAVIEVALRDLVPARCPWPGGHLGPWEPVGPYIDVKRCAACGEEVGK